MSGLQDAVVGWLGLTLLIAAALAVLVVDLARELVADGSRHPRWITITAFVVVPLLLLAGAAATVVRVATLAFT